MHRFYIDTGERQSLVKIEARLVPFIILNLDVVAHALTAAELLIHRKRTL